MAEVAKEVYTYESKCRRCGTIVSWYFSDADKIVWKVFVDAMQDYIQYPRTMGCNKCEKQTIQDIVSYEIKEN